MLAAQYSRVSFFLQKRKKLPRRKSLFEVTFGQKYTKYMPWGNLTFSKLSFPFSNEIFLLQNETKGRISVDYFLQFITDDNLSFQYVNLVTSLTNTQGNPKIKLSIECCLYQERWRKRSPSIVKVLVGKYLPKLTKLARRFYFSYNGKAFNVGSLFVKRVCLVRTWCNTLLRRKWERREVTLWAPNAVEILEGILPEKYKNVEIMDNDTSIIIELDQFKLTYS